tara:strand:- start:216 stop:419 length:204 start_codon:yes stop_codon:yes gene_type:complete
MEVVNMNRIFDNIVRKVICFTVSHSRLNSATRHPHSETTRMMVSAIYFLSEFTLAVYASSELAPPYH